MEEGGRERELEGERLAVFLRIDRQLRELGWLHCSQAQQLGGPRRLPLVAGEPARDIRAA